MAPKPKNTDAGDSKPPVDPTDPAAIAAEAERLEREAEEAETKRKAEEAAKATEGTTPPGTPPTIVTTEPSPPASDVVILNLKRAISVPLDEECVVGGKRYKKGERLHFRAGVNRVPVALKDNWYVKAVTLPSKQRKKA